MKCPVCGRPLPSVEADCPTCSTIEVSLLQPTMVSSDGEPVLQQDDDPFEQEESGRHFLFASDEHVAPWQPTQIVIKSGKEMRTLDLHPDLRYVVGRGPSCEVCIETDQFVSRKHGVLLHDGNQWKYLDLMSAGGSRVTTIETAERVVRGETPKSGIRRLEEGEVVGIERGTSVFLGQWTYLNLTDGDDEDAPLPSQTHQPHVLEMPFPLAVQTRPTNDLTTVARLSQRLVYLERTTTLMAAIAIALLERQAGLPRDTHDLLYSFGTRQIPLTGWAGLLASLCRSIDARVKEDAADTLRAFLDAKSGPSLIDRLFFAGETQANLAMGQFTESGWEETDRGIALLQQDILEAAGPLKAYRMVVREGPFDDGFSRDFKYRLRVLEGPSANFSHAEVELDERLKKKWCYLLHDSEKPISLEPFFLTDFAPNEGRSELFVATTLRGFGPLPPEMMSLTSSRRIVDGKLVNG